MIKINCVQEGKKEDALTHPNNRETWPQRDLEWINNHRADNHNKSIRCNILAILYKK
jgi:hypothetical protein